jgi:hypothetical protein
VKEEAVNKNSRQRANYNAVRSANCSGKSYSFAVLCDFVFDCNR